MKDYSQIFVDLDGPILEGKYRSFHCYEKIVLKYGGLPLSIDDYWNKKRDKTSVSAILNESYFPKENSIFHEEWMEEIESNENLNFDQLKPDIKDALIKLKRHTKYLFLFTMRNNSINTMAQIKTLGLDILFDNIFIVGTGENAKYEAIRRIADSSALIIGDSEIDLNTALQVGCSFIAISNGVRSSKFFFGCEMYSEVRDIKWLNIEEGVNETRG